MSKYDETSSIPSDTFSGICGSIILFLVSYPTYFLSFHDNNNNLLIAQIGWAALADLLTVGPTATGFGGQTTTGYGGSGETPPPGYYENNGSGSNRNTYSSFSDNSDVAETAFNLSGIYDVTMQDIGSGRIRFNVRNNLGRTDAYDVSKSDFGHGRVRLTVYKNGSELGTFIASEYTYDYETREYRVCKWDSDTEILNVKLRSINEKMCDITFSCNDESQTFRVNNSKHDNYTRFSVGTDVSYNAIAVDQVELRAKMLYDRFDQKHTETIVGNSSIVCEDTYSLIELKKLIRSKEKNQLINDLEALKQYKNNPELKLK